MNKAHIFHFGDWKQIFHENLFYSEITVSHVLMKSCVCVHATTHNNGHVIEMSFSVKRQRKKIVNKRQTKLVYSTEI